MLNPKDPGSAGRDAALNGANSACASDGKPAEPRPLVDDEPADQLLGKAYAEGAELLRLDRLPSQCTKTSLDRALAEEMTGTRSTTRPRGSGNAGMHGIDP